MRTTRGDLDGLAAIITRVTGREHFVQYAYGRPRLYTDDGAREVSPRLSTGDLAQWMRAYLAGFDAGERATLGRVLTADEIEAGRVQR